MSFLLLALTILVLSGLGGMAPQLLRGRLPDQRLRDLTAVAAGLLLASAILFVIPEGFDVSAQGAAGERAAAEHTDGDAADEGVHADEGDHGLTSETAFLDEPAVLGAALLAGFGLMLVLEGLGIGHDVHEEHHDHEEGHGHGHVHHPVRTSVLATGLSVHAAADGLAIGAASVAGETAFTVLVALAVVLHRVPAAFSLGVFALHETDDTRRAARWVGLFALATPAAMLVTRWLLDGASDRVVSLALLFSAGTFVYVATVDTLPTVHNPTTGRRSAVLVAAGAAAFALVLFGVDAAGWLEHSH